MTTGRINQVTVLPFRPLFSPSFLLSLFALPSPLFLSPLERGKEEEEGGRALGGEKKEEKGEKSFHGFLGREVVFSSFGFRERPSLPFASPPREGWGSGAGKTIRSNLPFCLLVPSSPWGERKNEASLGGLPSGKGSARLGRGVVAVGVHFLPSLRRPFQGEACRRRCELFGTGSAPGVARSGSTFSPVKGLGWTFSFAQREPAQSPISFLLPSPALPSFLPPGGRQERGEGPVRRRKRRSFSS